jgi:4-amino-4-deoxy-L-arabinose transferase-like glycosyltransferase
MRSIVAAADCLLGILIDPVRRERVIIWLLAAFIAAWTLYGLISHAGQDVHYDVGQLVGVSRDLAVGFYHPPMAVLVAGAWFRIFPRSAWASYLLVAFTVGVSLWIGWEIFGDWLEDTKRVVALAMLTLVPLLTFQALKFNANTAMIPFWAAATLFFLRSLNRRDPLNCALAGLMAGCALLTKYWSIYLIAGLGLASLLNSERRRYFTSSAPWITSAVGLAMIAPHLYFLTTGHRETLSYIGGAMAGAPLYDSIFDSLRYIAGAAAYIVVPLAIIAALRPSREVLADIILPGTAERRVVAIALWAPIILPAVINIVLPTRLTPLWTIPNWTLLPVVLLSPPMLSVSRRAAAHVLALAIVVPIAAIVAAPTVAVVQQLNHTPSERPHYKQAARAIDNFWHTHTGQPLRYIGGDSEMANGAAFYLDSAAPYFAPQTESSSDPKVTRDGIALICPAWKADCIAAVDSIMRRYGGTHEEVSEQRSALGIAGPPARFEIVVVPPAH